MKIRWYRIDSRKNGFSAGWKGSVFLGGGARSWLCHQHDVFVKKSSAALRYVKEKVIPERFAKSWCCFNSSWQELIYLQRKNVKSGLSLGRGTAQWWWGGLWISSLLRAGTINTKSGLCFSLPRRGWWVISPDDAPECIWDKWFGNLTNWKNNMKCKITLFFQLKSVLHDTGSRWKKKTVLELFAKLIY